MATIKEVFGEKYAEARQTGNVEGFKDFVKSKVSITNLAKAVKMSTSAVSSRMKNPLALMELIASHKDDEINASTSRNVKQITLNELPDAL